MVKVCTRQELMKLRDRKEKVERDTLKRENAKMEIELTGTVEPNDLVLAMKKVTSFLDKGMSIIVRIVRRCKWLEPPAEVCEKLLQHIREAVA